MSFPIKSQNIIAELKQLIDQSNQEFLFQFIEYLKGRVSPEHETEIRNHITEYIQTVLVQTKKSSSTHSSSDVSKQCSYTIKRGLNNGKQCSNHTKDVSGLCGKHRHSKVEAQPVAEEPEPRFWDVVDDDVLEKENEEEEEEDLVGDEIDIEPEEEVEDVEEEPFFSL